MPFPGNLKVKVNGFSQGKVTCGMDNLPISRVGMNDFANIPDARFQRNHIYSPLPASFQIHYSRWLTPRAPYCPLQSHLNETLLVTLNARPHIDGKGHSYAIFLFISTPFNKYNFFDFMYNNYIYFFTISLSHQS